MSLESLAERYLGDAVHWKSIAMANNLKAPYISQTGAPNTIKYGQQITIPSSNHNPDATRIMDRGAGQSPEDMWGIDIALYETKESISGRPSVDLTIDPKSGRDVALVKGKNNLTQAVQMRIWTEIGSLPNFPRYGLPKMVGVNFPWYKGQALRLSVRDALREDSRISSVGKTKVTVDKDFIEVDVTVNPIGKSEGITIPTSLT